MNGKAHLRGTQAIGTLLVVCTLALAPAFVPAADAASRSYFTQQQAQAGRQVYDGNCAKCHGAHLQGGAGPALTGHKFEHSLKYGSMSASQLFNFIANYMPKKQPGSLSQKQYLAVMAYLLSQNGFSSDDASLEKKSLGQVKLLPFPKDSGQSK